MKCIGLNYVSSLCPYHGHPSPAISYFEFLFSFAPAVLCVSILVWPKRKLQWGPDLMCSWLQQWPHISVWTRSPCEHSLYICWCTHIAQRVVKGKLVLSHTYIEAYLDTHKHNIELNVCQLFHSAFRSEPKQIQCKGCYKKWSWHLLNQIEIKIVKYEPNPCNLLLAFLQRFELLQFFLFNANLTHIHTLMHLNWCSTSVQIVTYCWSYYIREGFHSAFIENPNLFSVIHDGLDAKVSRSISVSNCKDSWTVNNCFYLLFDLEEKTAGSCNTDKP